ncbi:MAG: serine protein kinase RIO [Euryarchaeota archaeon]|nr:serine protein kinase RIO [Euryarchaeota archaeon]MBU4222862.1 serine protein kinase RIO [Euryarchaeota archaeon]MBU4340280.1 serine protein kinase RIO [Euryarchaeota archaeon]MCG2735486.1 serine protein kinase RIO [Candidatus Methanoperedenaceae archaeon]MDP3105322.1 serine protein kinase RIO [Candidatus Methanoperedens sp.]
MVSDSKIRRMDEKVDEFRMRIKDSSQRAVFGDVFDDATLMALYELAKKGYIDAMGGSVSTGKEANVFHAISKEYGEVAVKIFMMSTANFNAMKDYILGDPRFMGIRHTRKDIILAWARKEFKNLKRAQEAGVRVPEPYVVKRNILLMEFIGNDGVAMPQLKDVIMTQDDAQRIFNKIVEYMSLLYGKAKLIHADLSEYNILVDLNDMSPVFIDMGQSVTTDHVNAETFLIRDVNNVARFFKKLDIRINEEEIMTMIKEVEK